MPTATETAADTLLAAALALPKAHRLRLAEALWASCEVETAVGDAEDVYDAELLAEWRRRSEALQSGAARAVPAEQIFARLRSKLDS